MNEIKVGHLYRNKETSGLVLALMIDDYYVFFQKDKFVNNKLKHEFLDEYDYECKYEHRELQEITEV